jgi:hypothetical protein
LRVQLSLKGRRFRTTNSLSLSVRLA